LIDTRCFKDGASIEIGGGLVNFGVSYMPGTPRYGAGADRI
jgi:hypothetical protein